MAQFTSAEYHHALAQEYARRHFSDPELSIADAAAYAGVHRRTLARSLAVRHTSWRTMLHELRRDRAKELLETTIYPINDVARLCGYNSRSAFARMFEQATSLKPSEYRRAKKGPARTGAPTGAFAGSKEPTRPGLNAGFDAVMAQRTQEAHSRIADRRELEGGRREASVVEIADEDLSPRRLRDDPAYWRQRRKESDRWAEAENKAPKLDIGSAGRPRWHA